MDVSLLQVIDNGSGMCKAGCMLFFDICLLYTANLLVSSRR